MIAMAKKKQGRGRPPKDLEPLQMRVSPDLAAALRRLVDETRRSLNAELTLALESHLEAAGVWSRKPPAKS